MSLDYRHRTVMAAVGVCVVLLAIGFAQGNVRPAMIFLAIQGLVLGTWFWLTRPSSGVGHLSHRAALTAAGDDGVIVYWRPG